MENILTCWHVMKVPKHWLFSWLDNFMALVFLHRTSIHSGFGRSDLRQPHNGSAGFVVQKLCMIESQFPIKFVGPKKGPHNAAPRFAFPLQHSSLVFGSHCARIALGLKTWFCCFGLSKRAKASGHVICLFVCLGPNISLFVFKTLHAQPALTLQIPLQNTFVAHWITPLPWQAHFWHSYNKFNQNF